MRLPIAGCIQISRFGGRLSMKTALCFLIAATLVFGSAGAATAQWVTSYYAAPVTAYYTPTVTNYGYGATYTPSVSYYAPTTTYYAPTTSYYAPTSTVVEPTTTYYSSSVPTTTYYSSSVP